MFLDYHVYEEDISISSNWEVFLEVLNGNTHSADSFKYSIPKTKNTSRDPRCRHIEAVVCLIYNFILDVKQQVQEIKRSCKGTYCPGKSQVRKSPAGVRADRLLHLFSEPEKMKSMSQLAVLTRRWSPATMKLGPFQEVILESSSVEELKEKVCLCYLTVQSLPHDLYCC